MLRIDATTGQKITLDIDAASIGSGFDSYLRLFNSGGQEVAANDDSGGSYDSYLTYTVPASGARTRV